MLLLISIWCMIIKKIQYYRLTITGLIWCLLLSLNNIIHINDYLILFNSFIKWDIYPGLLEIILWLIALVYIGGKNKVEKLLTLWCAILLLYTNDLMCMFIVLEFQSLILYLLIAKYSISSSLKYFIIGSLASTLIILGIALVIKELIVLGMLIKLGTPPFHQWNIDIIDSIEIEMVAWFSTIGKLSLIYVLVYFIQPSLIILVGVLACFFIGTFMGLIQIKVKRLIAYSGIIHLGFMLLGKGDSTIIYMLVYSISLICFLIIIDEINAFYIQDIKVNYYTYPLLIVNILSLAGFPPFIGFIGKLFVIESIVSYLFWIGMIAMLISMLSFFIYFNIIRVITINNVVISSWYHSWLISFGTLSPLLFLWQFTYLPI